MAAMDTPGASSQRAGRSGGHSRSPGRTTPTARTPPPASEARATAMKALLDGMKQLEQQQQAVIAAGQAHEQRIAKLEAEAKVVDGKLNGLNDGIGVLGRHCQDGLAELDGKFTVHIGGTVSDLNAAMLAVDVALRSAMQGTQDRFVEFQGDAKELMNRTEKAVKQLQGKVTEVEKALEDLKKIEGGGQKLRPQEPEWYDISSPAVGAAAASSGKGAGTAWQTGSDPWQPGAGAGGKDDWRSGKGAGAAWQTGLDPWQPGAGGAGTWWTKAEPWVPPSSWQSKGDSTHLNSGHARDASGLYPPNIGSLQDPTNPGGSTRPWPPPAGGYASLRLDSTIFETKFAQYKDNQFDGQKGGEHWKALVGN